MTHQVIQTKVRNASKSASVPHLIYQTNVILYTLGLTKRRWARRWVSGANRRRRCRPARRSRIWLKDGGAKKKLLTKFLTKTIIIQAVAYVILQSIATSLVIQLIIEMHIAHDYTHYVQSRKCIDIQTTWWPACRHLVRNWTMSRTMGRPHWTVVWPVGPSSFSQTVRYTFWSVSSSSQAGCKI